MDEHNTSKEYINIMTSTNSRLIPYVYVQLKTISVFFKGRNVNFFLFQNSITEFALESLKDYCISLGNVSFFNVFIDDISFYTEIAKYGGGWPEEAYFSLLCHEYLPNFVHRILYIDAGDVFFYGENREIDDFYYADFDGNLLLGFSANITAEKKFQSTTFYMFDGSIMEDMLSTGVYLINIDGFRQSNITNKEYYLFIRDKGLSRNRDILKVGLPDFYVNDVCYVGDQDFIQNAFEKDLKFFYGQNSDLSFTPYHFITSLFDHDKKELWYVPFILHLHSPKPWSNSYESRKKVQKQNMVYYEFWDSLYDETMREISLLPEFWDDNTTDIDLLYQNRSVSKLPLIYKDSKIVLWGSGHFAQKITKLLRRYHKKIHCFCDSNPDKWSEKISDYTVISPEKLASWQQEVKEKILVIVSVSERYESEVLENCKILSIQNTMTIDEVKKSFLANDEVVL